MIIVDDVLATGGTMKAAANLATQTGYEVAALVSLVDLNLAPAFDWNGMTVRSLIKYA